jgi:hypothetical protein
MRGRRLWFGFGLLRIEGLVEVKWHLHLDDDEWLCSEV